MEYEYDGVEEYGGRILWGRIAFFTVALLLVFFLGRCTESGGVPMSQVQQLEEQVADLSEQNTRLNDQLAAAQANASSSLAGSRQEASEDESESTDERESSTEAETESGTSSRERSSTAGLGSRTYVVQKGDYLYGIAERFYGDRSQADLIAAANGITDESPLRVGQRLIIPSESDER